MAELHCKNCGHPAGCHSTPVCGYDHGSQRPERCQCPKFEPLELTRLQAKLAEVEAERDAYMQAVIDTIHLLARRIEAPAEADLSGSPEGDDR